MLEHARMLSVVQKDLKLRPEVAGTLAADAVLAPAAATGAGRIHMTPAACYRWLLVLLLHSSWQAA